MKYRIGILFIFLATFHVFAADTLSVRKKFLFAGLNSISYKGSLSPTYAVWTPAFKFGVAFQKRKILNEMLSLTFGRFIGESRDYKLPSTANSSLQPVNRFRTDFISINYDLQILLFQYRSLRIFISQGVGLMRFTPKDWDGNILIDRNRTRNPDEDFNSVTLSFPTQIGLRYSFSNGMAFGFQAGWLNVRSNYLDNMNELSDNSRGDNLAVYRMQYFIPLK